MTFADVFSDIELYSTPIISIKEQRNMLTGARPLGDIYTDRITKIKNDITILNELIEKKEEERQDVCFDQFDIEHLGAIKKGLSTKANELEKIYDQIVERQEKYRKVIEFIEAINEIVNTIDREIIILNSDKYIIDERSGKSIFEKTIAMLSDERKKYTEWLKKYSDITGLMDELFSNTISILNEVSELRVSYNLIIQLGLDRYKERNEQDNGKNSTTGK